MSRKKHFEKSKIVCFSAFNLSATISEPLTCESDDERDGCRCKQDAYEDILELLNDSLPERFFFLSVEFIWPVLLQTLLCLCRSQTLLDVCFVILEGLLDGHLVRRKLRGIHLLDQLALELLLLLLSF